MTCIGLRGGIAGGSDHRYTHAGFLVHGVSAVFAGRVRRVGSGYDAGHLAARSSVNVRLVRRSVPRIVPDNLKTGVLKHPAGGEEHAEAGNSRGFGIPVSETPV